MSDQWPPPPGTPPGPGGPTAWGPPAVSVPPNVFTPGAGRAPGSGLPQIGGAYPPPSAPPRRGSSAVAVVAVLAVLIVVVGGVTLVWRVSNPSEPDAAPTTSTVSQPDGQTPPGSVPAAAGTPQEYLAITAHDLGPRFQSEGPVDRSNTASPCDPKVGDGRKAAWAATYQYLTHRGEAEGEAQIELNQYASPAAARHSITERRTSRWKACFAKQVGEAAGATQAAVTTTSRNPSIGVSAVGDRFIIDHHATGRPTDDFWDVDFAAVGSDVVMLTTYRCCIGFFARDEAGQLASMWAAAAQLQGIDVPTSLLVQKTPLVNAADACALLSSNDFAADGIAVTGVPVSSAPIDGADQCTWQAIKGGTPLTLQVTSQIPEYGPQDAVIATGTPIDGFGDRAFVDTENELWITNHGTWMDLEVTVNGTFDLVIEKQVASQVEHHADEQF